MSSMNQIASDLYKSLTESNDRKPKPYDTKAEVLREDGDVVWVKIPGGIDETPVQKTNNAKAGDTVMVRVSGGRAWLLGNNTSPATDDTKANQAYTIADIAIKDANRAQEAANYAEAEADRAHAAADEAKADASTARTAAETANLGLSMVEDIVGVLDWIGDHSTVTTDTSPVEGKTYYKKNQDGTYTKIEDPTGKNPAQEGWYELDEAIQDFINSHLSLTGTGLYLANMNNGWKVLISSGATQAYPAGVYLIDPNGRTAQATTASGISFDQTKAFTVGNGNAFIYFDPAGNSGQGSITISGSSIRMGSLTLDEILNNTLIYDHTYEYYYGDQSNPNKPTRADFTAYLYRGGVDVKTEFTPASDYFFWYIKKDDKTTGNVVEELIGTGYTCSVNIADCGYGAEIVGKFVTQDNAEALSTRGDTLTNVDDETLTVRATGDSIRVRDLSTTSVIFPTDKLMIVGSEDEHLASIQTLQDYLNANLDKQVLFDTTENWSRRIDLVSEPNTLYIYTDHQHDDQGNPVAGIKVGDGNAYVVDLPFTDAVATEHIADNTCHITDAEREAWNNKVRCYYAGSEQLVFTTT